MNHKVCAKCKVDLPATNEFFPLNKRLKYGVGCYCKKCNAKSQTERRLSNPEKEKEIRDRSYAKTKDVYNAKRVLRYQNDPEFKAKRKALDLRRKELGRRKKENMSEESWKKHLERSKRARKKNPERTILYNNYYRKIKGDLVIAKQRKQRAELSDSYIKQVIQKNLRDEGVHVSRSEIPMDFIELKRKQLNIYRDVKNKKN